MPTTTTNHVLFVEDDQLISDLVGQKFIAEDIDIKHAPTGETALEMIKEDPKPGLILLDIRLPGIDGFEVLKTLKEQDETKDIPVIIFSNFGEESDKRRAAELGAKQYIVKVSRSLDEMANLVRSELEPAA